MSDLIEEWRPFVGWPYEVSSFGRVRRTQPGARNNPGTKVGRILSQCLSRDRYLWVVLCRDGRKKMISVHRLVCIVFHGDPIPGKDIARHLDGDRFNNVPENLAWGSSQDNSDDMKLHGTVIANERHPCAKLTDDQVRQLRHWYHELKQSGPRALYGELSKKAAELGMNVASLHNAVNGRSYRGVLRLDPIETHVAAAEVVRVEAGRRARAGVAS